MNIVQIVNRFFLEQIGSSVALVSQPACTVFFYGSFEKIIVPFLLEEALVFKTKTRVNVGKMG